ncbi:MAG: NfeD family protein [Casimicrobiaceae bacterium]
MTTLLSSIVAAILGCVTAAAAAVPAPVLVIPLTGAIGPASADFVGRSLSRAAAEGAQLAVLQIDTPGGLDLSMRQIVKDILASPVPVVAFVAPGGARAASAGTYILYASHIAAMAPGTNLGAATPINIGMPAPAPGPAAPKPGDASKPAQGGDREAGAEPSTLEKKQVHDAAAYIRALAQLRGRNAAWGERAVREAVSLSADEALAQHVIDLTARDVPELLSRLDGRKVTTAAGERVLATSGAIATTLAPDWRTRFLAIITDPSVALMLLMAGVYGLFFEFWNPGLALPGVLGAICLLLGLFALQMLPVNYAGLGLVLLGIAFIVAETFLPTYGSLGVGGIVAFAIGAVMLIDTDVPGFGVPYWLIGTLAAVTALFVFIVAGVALKARRRPIVTGDEGLIGSVGVALDDLETEGWARIHSEQWRVTSPVPIKRGQRVRVTARSDLLLSVLPVSEVEQGA